MKKALLIFLLLFSFSFSSLLWQYNANGEITTKPVLYSNSLVFSSADGSIILLNHINGAKIWESKVSGTPTQVIVFQNKIAVGTKEGNVYLIGAAGSQEWMADLTEMQNISYLYGIDGSGSMIYITTDSGVYSLDSAGQNLNLVYSSPDIKSAPVVFGNSVLFGDGDDLVRINTGGAVQWKRNVGGIWLSRPVVDGTVVYVGGLDRKMHSFVLSSGNERWAYESGNWILSTPLVSNGNVYFGSNDGSVYAVDQTSGALQWSTKTSMATQGQPVSGTLGEDDVIFVGSTDSSIYAFDKQTGIILWSGSARNWVSEPIFHQNFVYFGSSDKSVYAFSTERACSILSPKEGEVIGFKEVKVTGNAISNSGSKEVEVQVNNGLWEKAQVIGDKWEYFFDPSVDLVSGINTILCRVSDSAGVETGKFTERGVVHEPDLLKGQLLVTTKGKKLEGETFEIFVNDNDDGSPIERFSISLNGKTYNGSGSVNVSVDSGGSYSLNVKKVGYDDANLKLDIASAGINAIFLVIPVILIVIIAYLVYTRFIAKK
jgi:outer membrane protein assembly factor BamB